MTTPIKKINDTTFRSGKVRLSYPHIHTPAPKTDNDGKQVLDAAGQPVLIYKCVFIIPKTETATVAALKEAMTNAAKATFRDRVPPGWAKGLRDGDTDPAALIDPLDEAKGRKPELVGCYWINATSYQKPRVLSKTKDEFTNEFKELTKNDIKAGDWVRAQINAYGFDVTTNKGVAFGFAAIQMVEEGEALAGGGVVLSAFEDDEELADSFM